MICEESKKGCLHLQILPRDLYDLQNEKGFYTKNQVTLKQWWISIRIFKDFFSDRPNLTNCWLFATYFFTHSKQWSNKWRSHSTTVKSWAVDRSTIQFLIIFGVLLTETCYCCHVQQSMKKTNHKRLHELISTFAHYILCTYYIGIRYFYLS